MRIPKIKDWMDGKKESREILIDLVQNARQRVHSLEAREGAREKWNGPIKIEFTRAGDSPWVAPQRIHDASRWELYASRGAIIDPTQSVTMPTGAKIDLKNLRGGVDGIITAPGGWRTRGVALLGGVQLVSSSGRDEITITLVNFGTEQMVIEPGDTIGQVTFIESRSSTTGCSG